jgi:hypothetical protein
MTKTAAEGKTIAVTAGPSTTKVVGFAKLADFSDYIQELHDDGAISSAYVDDTGAVVIVDLWQCHVATDVTL